MEGGESPLEVLSRAATMLQENQQALTSSDDTKQQQSNKQLPTTKWKRDRRSRLPEYSRKSDPKVPEAFYTNNGDQPGTPPSPESPSSTSSSTSPLQLATLRTVPPVAMNGTAEENGDARTSSQTDTPLDMSVRQRGLPPSYAQTVNNPSYRSSYRQQSVINAGPTRDELPSGISMCDTIIDEHFRRSLGKDYMALFNNNVSPKESPPVMKTPPKVTTNVIELMDSTGLSVDDHFAKALGDTWLKLNKKEPEIKTTASDTPSMVSI